MTRKDKTITCDVSVVSGCIVPSSTRPACPPPCPTPPGQNYTRRECRTRRRQMALSPSAAPTSSPAGGWPRGPSGAPVARRERGRFPRTASATTSTRGSRRSRGSAASTAAPPRGSPPAAARWSARRRSSS